MTIVTAGQAREWVANEWPNQHAAPCLTHSTVRRRTHTPVMGIRLALFPCQSRTHFCPAAAWAIFLASPASNFGTHGPTPQLMSASFQLGAVSQVRQSEPEL